MNITHKILVVDDVDDNRDIICRHLRKFEYDFRQAESGDEALRAIEMEDFDLVLLDIMMPGIDGIEVLTRLRKRFSASELPIIMVTAKNSPEDISHALDLGANDYLTKPVSRRVLNARVSTHLKAADSQRGLQQKIDELFEAHERLQNEIIVRRRMEEQAHYHSYHDRLTGLGNWNYLQERMEAQISLASFSKSHTLAIAIAIRDFRALNETLGFSSGDAVLTQFAEILRSIAGKDAYVARIGAGKFFVSINGGGTRQETAVLGERLVQKLHLKAQKLSNCAPCSLEFGLAMSQEDGADAHSLRRAAEVALSNCGAESGSFYCFFDRAFDQEIQKDRVLKDKLKLAIKNEEMQVYFQPIVSPYTLETVGHEALSRWRDSDGQWHSPVKFIALAEEDNTILELGKNVLVTALRESKKYFPSLKISVNVSSLQFADPNFLGTVVRALHVTDFDASLLELELTESILIREPERAIRKIEQLRSLGVRVCLDDFGTGYSSLSYLADFPIDKIKIDKSFVDKLFLEKNSRNIVSSIMKLGSSMKCCVTVEGVEDEEQFNWLKAEGCDEIQGYYFAKPMPVSECYKQVSMKKTA